MKKIYLISLLIAIVLISTIVVKLIKKEPEPVLEFEFDREAYKNFLDYSLNKVLEEKKEPEGFCYICVLIDSYDILELEIPRKQEVIDYILSNQLDDGSFWGGNHYAPKTFRTLMVLDRMEIRPLKSLDPFFEKTDTLDEVINDYEKYGISGPWGEMWGYVGTWVVQKNQTPPWMNEFWQASYDRFNQWAYDSHQRTHFAGSLSQVCMKWPRHQEVIDIILKSQNPNGSWEQTGFTVLTLNAMEVTGPEAEQAKQKAVNYILNNLYTTWEENGKKMAAFIGKDGSMIVGPDNLEALVQERVISGNPNIWDYRVCQ